MTPEIRAKISAAQPGPRGGWRNETGRVFIGKEPRARIVWDEAHPDDPLKPGEVIHHINGIKDDDRPENLMKLPSQAEHASLHMRRPRSPEHIRNQAISQMQTKAAQRTAPWPESCERCGTSLRKKQQLERNRFCSPACAYASHRGKSRSGW